jgi:hypothetical protein
MIYITQLIYLSEGQEKVFEEFESIAIPIISKYNGNLLLRIRPEENSIISGTLEKPYEIHFISFDSTIDFEKFSLDEERKKILHLKNQAIQESLLIVGEKM